MTISGSGSSRSWLATLSPTSSSTMLLNNFRCTSGRGGAGGGRDALPRNAMGKVLKKELAAWG